LIEKSDKEKLMELVVGRPIVAVDLWQGDRLRLQSVTMEHAKMVHVLRIFERMEVPVHQAGDMAKNVLKELVNVHGEV